VLPGCLSQDVTLGIGVVAISLALDATDWHHEALRTAGLLMQGERPVAGHTDWGGIHSRTHHKWVFL
jgi:hypothetical protein